MLSSMACICSWLTSISRCHCARCAASRSASPAWADAKRASKEGSVDDGSEEDIRSHGQSAGREERTDPAVLSSLWRALLARGEGGDTRNYQQRGTESAQSQREGCGAGAQPRAVHTHTQWRG